MAKIKTKKMTIKYWCSLPESSRKRALTYCFPINQAVIDMLMEEKPCMKSIWWQLVFKKIRMPAEECYYKTVFNNETFLP